jgi:N-methylhydantoinase B/oxoprolinase/acetone carboxylase alpha subunit
MAPCRDLYGEGLVIPPIVLERDGRFVRDALRMVLANVRTPDERRADLLAQCAANRRGAARVAALAGRYGVPRLARAAQAILDRPAGDAGASRAAAVRTFRTRTCSTTTGWGRATSIRVASRIARRRATIDARRGAAGDGSLNANPRSALGGALLLQCLRSRLAAAGERMARPLSS